MPTISFGGLGNGLDFGQVVDQLVKVAQLPVDRLTKKRTDLNAKLTDLTTVSTKVAALQSAAEALRLSTSFDRTTVSVSDSTVLSASSSSSGATGTYSVRVVQLAQSHQIVSKAAKAAPSETADIVSGGSATFTFTVGSGSNQTVNLGSTATLADLRDQINDLGAGVTASLINTGTEAAPSYRLALSSNNTGSDNAITIVADGTDLDLLNGSGTGGIDTLSAAQNAQVQIGDQSLDPLTIERSSNTITDAIPGLSLTLTKTTGAETVQVSLSQDVNAVKTNIKALATAYNEVVKFINERSTYDVATKQGGVFFNESSARTVIAQLRTALSSSVNGATTYTSVGQIGFKTERDGTIAVDDGQLTTALNTNYGAVKALFVNQGSAAGLAQSLVSTVDALNDVVGGALTLRKNGLTSEITRVGDDIARQEDAVSRYEERLRRQFAALDGLLRQLQGQSSFLQSQSSSNQSQN
ncbi:MAG: flagellar filament capping protein FliD [Nitrospira sp.]|jgi:flagellar hook-associated protein 2|nr:flagellar filament capping protein FliD [Nitrospira sp.]MDH4245400.1 flagellar filament capping protein FliD [Nitrospira sp.]MDH4354979.1 flagellar filament capping protein FliD [Nitrospira sp.]MDH5317210.1 flagellar filament capping protein FliD [Nitrospira sp.]